MSAGDRTYEVQDPISLKVSIVDIERLRIWKSSTSTLSEEQVLLRDQDLFMVEKIVRHAGSVKKLKTMRFLVKWIGYEAPTWEPYENLRNNLVLYEYAKSNGLKLPIVSKFEERASL